MVLKLERRSYKVSLFINDMIIYLETSREPSGKSMINKTNSTDIINQKLICKQIVIS